MKANRLVSVMVGAALLLPFGASAATDWETLNARSRTEALTVLRPGVPGESPFWNTNAWAFIHPPAIAFGEVAGAVNYRITVTEEATGIPHVFLAEKPWTPLTEVWDALPCGYFTVSAVGLDGEDVVVGTAPVAGRTRFWRAAPFAGPYLPGARDYADAARRIYAGVYSLSHVQAWTDALDEPPAGYDLYCYPAKIIPAIITACLRQASNDVSCAETARTIACHAADWLLSVSQPAGAVLPYLPPTYWGNRRGVATEYAGQNMLSYPAHAALAYLDLYDAVQDEKYRTAALNIAATMKSLQNAQGTWSLKVYESNGEPVTQNLMIPDEALLELFAKVADLTGDASYATAAESARNYILSGPYVDWNWEGQFEDARPSMPYVNLAKDRAAQLSAWMFAHDRADEGRTLIDWCEDQFTVWSSPISTGTEGSSGWVLPAALEQYAYYTPIDASCADMIRGFARAAQATGDELYLEKAKALADNVTRLQRADGTIPTYFSGRQSSDWVNCMVYTAEALETLAAIAGPSSRVETWIDQPFGTYTAEHPGLGEREGGTNVWRVTASGRNFCGSDVNDGGRFVFRPMEGDFILTVEVAPLPIKNDAAGISAWPRAGLMIRASSDVSADLASIFRRSGGNETENRNQVRADWRVAGTTKNNVVTLATASEWMRLKLVRCGGTVYAYAAPESAPDAWQLVATESVPFGDRVLAGFFVTKTSSSTCDEVTGRFRNPCITPIVDPIVKADSVSMTVVTNLPWLDYAALQRSFGGANFFISRLAGGKSAGQEVLSRAELTTAFTDAHPTFGYQRYQAFVDSANYTKHEMGMSAPVWFGVRQNGVSVPTVQGLTEVTEGGQTVRTGTIRPTVGGLYTFVVRAAGHVELEVDGARLLSTTDNAERIGDRVQHSTTAPVRLEAGRAYPFTFTGTADGVAGAEILWVVPGAETPEAVPSSAFEPGCPDWPTHALGAPAGSGAAYDATTGLTTLTVAGAPLAATFDAARLLGRKVTSPSGFLRDFSFAAAVLPPASGARAEGGILVASGLEGYFKRIGVSLRPNGGALDLVFAQRAQVDGAVQETVLQEGLPASATYSFKFVRTGLDMTFHLKEEGGDWTAVKTLQMPLPADVWVGAFAQASGDAVESVRVGAPELTLGEEWETRPLEADAYVQDAGAHGLQSGLIVGENRESLLRFDATGLEDATNVVLQMYVTQHPASALKPFVFQVMRDTFWNEATATLDNMRHEVPFIPSPWIAQTDPLYAGCATVFAQNDWIQADITAATRREAARTGKMSLHMISIEKNGGGQNVDPKVDCFASRENEDASQRPLVAFKRPAPAPAASPDIVVCEATDTVCLDKNILSARTDALLANPGVRDSFLKFDLSEMAGRIGRATLRLVTTDAPNNAASDVAFRLVGNGWSESEVRYGQTSTYPTGADVLRSWPLPLPTNTVHYGATIKRPSATNDIDVTALARLGAATSEGALSLHVFARDQYMIFNARSAADAAVRPHLIVEMVDAECMPSIVRDATGYPSLTWSAIPGATSYRVERASDPAGTFETVGETASTALLDATCPGASTWWYRVTAVRVGDTLVSKAVAFVDAVAPASRTALLHGVVFYNNNNGTSENSATFSGTTMQVGNVDTRVLNGYLLFDPSGLAHAPYVRLRLKTVDNNNNQTGEARLFGAVTDYWNPTNLTWNRGMEWFTHVTPIPDATQPNELARLKYNIRSGVYELSPYMEFDVTELVREAARQGRYATFQVTGSHYGFWRWFCTEEHGTVACRPTLFYPPVEGFGEELRLTTDWTSDPPTGVLSWRGGPAGTTYTVECTELGKDRWRTLATDVSDPACVDEKVFPESSFVYRVTATLPNGQTLVRTVTNELDVAQRVSCIADTYVRDGQATTRFGTDNMIVLKDGGSGAGGTREGLIRFDISGIPAKAKELCLNLRVYTVGQFNGNERCYFRVMNDVDWTDAAAPTWNEIFPGRGGRPSEPGTEGYFAYLDQANGSPITNYRKNRINVSSLIAAARAAGQTHLLIHCYLDDPEHQANFSFISRESAMGPEDRPYISWTRPNWHTDGTVLFFR